MRRVLQYDHVEVPPHVDILYFYHLQSLTDQNNQLVGAIHNI